MTRLLLILISPFLLCSPLSGETSLRIAVAANFHHTLDQIAHAYQAAHPQTQIILIPGSTGKLYAQIANGAPFHAFFSADAQRPAKLAQTGLAPPESRFTFALGILAFWQPGNPEPNYRSCKTLALASPKLAPFGLASEQALAALHLDTETVRTVLGSNVAQAFTFAQTGAADSAFVSLSQLRQTKTNPSEYLIVDPNLYQPIEQQAVALGQDDATRSFLLFCQSEAARSLIEQAGYRLPPKPEGQP